jgi:hypothetical protein
MATLPRSYNSTTTTTDKKSAADAAGGTKYKKSKRLSWTLGRKKSRDEAIVADGSGEALLLVLSWGGSY